jgi:hypothetical protein
MSGALEASREGGRAKIDHSKKKGDEKKESKGRNGDKDRGRGVRGGGRGGGRNGDRGGRGGGRHGDRGGRSIQRDAFDRLTRGGPSRDGFDRRRDDNIIRRSDRDSHAGRPGRSGGRGRSRDGRDASHGRASPGRGDRMSGNRRGRNEDDYDDFMPVEDRRPGRERGGRGGRGRMAPDGPHKIPRYDDGYGDDNNYSHDSGYSYDDGYNGAGYPFPSRRSGRGEGERGRGRELPGGGRGRGRNGRGGRGEETTGGGAPSDGATLFEQRIESGDMPSDAANHPSPIVQSSYLGGHGAFGYSYGGRGRFGGRARVHGRTFPGRAEVVNMIQSKTWVRKKADGDGGGQSLDAQTIGEPKG